MDSFSAWTVVVVAVSIFYLFYRSRFIARVLAFQRQRSRTLVCIEVTPFIRLEETSVATQELFSILWHSFGPGEILSLEVAASRKSGTRYVICVAKQHEQVLRRSILSYMPKAKCRTIDIESSSISNSYIFELRRAGPLRIRKEYMLHDEVMYLTSAMANLQAGESIVVQFVVSPSNMHDSGVAHHTLRAFLISRWWVWATAMLYGELASSLSAGISLAMIELSISFFLPARGRQRLHVQSGIKSTVDTDGFSFYVDTRVLVVTNDKNRARTILNTLHSSLSSLGMRGLHPFLLKGFVNSYILLKFKGRLPALFTINSSILSSYELAALYHFPYKMLRSEDLLRHLAPSLPVPLVTRRRADEGNFDLEVGISNYRDSNIAIGLTDRERERHVYIIGGTGSGKTTLMEYAILQDIKNGKGVGVIDPHGDMAQRLLQYIPKDRIKDVIYLNPADIKYPIGLNLLELPDCLDPDDLLLEKERVTEGVVSVLRKVFAEDSANAHRIESILRNAIYTAMTVEGATIFTVLKLLRNAAYRYKVTSKLEDEDLKDFWKQELGNAGSMQRIGMTKGVTARIDRFRSSEPARRMLAQEKSTINFEDIINTKKILICNFGQGKLGEDTSVLFGTTVLAKLKMAAQRRDNIPVSERIPFYLYVDEFQNFATVPFVKMMSEARKYRLLLTVAEQTTAQQEDSRLTDAILANVGTLICFRTGSVRDERLLLPHFTPFIEEGDIAHLSAHEFYLKDSAIEPIEPMSGKTVLLQPLSKQDAERTSTKVIGSSRQIFAIQYDRNEKGAI